MSNTIINLIALWLTVFCGIRPQYMIAYIDMFPIYYRHLEIKSFISISELLDKHQLVFYRG